MGLINNMSLTDFLYSKIIIVPAMLLAFTFHEFAHAKVADMLGDKTPRFQGRLTLNPASHLDPLGTLLIFLVGFGWAKPVETNPRVFKNYYKDDLKVSIAGPLANLVLSFLGMLLYGIFVTFGKGLPFVPASIFNVIAQMLYAICTLNAGLFLFNLLPAPGLDGFWVLRDLLPKHFNNISNSIYRYQMAIWIAVVFVGSRLLFLPTMMIVRFFYNIVSIIL